MICPWEAGGARFECKPYHESNEAVPQVLQRDEQLESTGKYCLPNFMQNKI